MTTTQSRKLIRYGAIPYATAARWERPVDKEVAGDARDMATINGFSPAAPQNLSEVANAVPNLTTGLQMSEDCLNLSVLVPDNEDTPEGPLPVFVWMHGGANISGAGDSPEYRPDYFAAEQNVIVVAVNYRLGFFGFVGMREEHANLGLLDMISALRWVHRHIADFGGDPDNVTIGGQSSASDCVMGILASGLTDGLFQRAILDSWPGSVFTDRDSGYAALRKRAGELTTLEDALEMDFHQLLDIGVEIQSVIPGHGNEDVAYGIEWGRYPLPPEGRRYEAAAEGLKGREVLVGTNTRETAFPALKNPKVYSMITNPITSPLMEKVILPKTTKETYEDFNAAFVAELRRQDVALRRYFFTFNPDDVHPARRPRQERNFMGSAHMLDILLLFPNRSMAEHSVMAKNLSYDDLVVVGAPLRSVWAEFVRSGTTGIDAGRGAPQLQWES